MLAFHILPSAALRRTIFDKSDEFSANGILLLMGFHLVFLLVATLRLDYVSRRLVKVD